MTFQPATVTGRLDFLDAIRGLAALGVLCLHVLEISIPAFRDASLRYFHLGPFSLALFMIVSGFIIPASLDRAGSVGHFGINRFFRLFPIYWLSLAILFAISLFLPLQTAFDPRQVWHWIANFTMLQEFFGVPNAIPVFWTLTVELVFYGFCCILFQLRLLNHSIVLAWLGVAGFAVAGIALPILAQRRFPAGYAFLYISALFGMVFHHWHAGAIHWRQVARLLAGLLAVGCGVCYLNFEFLRRHDGFTFTSVFAAWVSAFVVFLVFFALRGLRVPSLLQGLGKISYSVYLLHPLVMNLTPGDWSAPANFATVVLGTLSTASVAYFFVERPLIHLGRRLTKRPAVTVESALPSRAAA